MKEVIKSKNQKDKMTVEQTAEATADAPDVNATDETQETQAATPPPEPTTEELLAQANDRYLRARADFENYRKRMGREVGEIRESARQQTIAEFLNVFDMFLLAVDHADQATDLESLKQGLNMILSEFQRTFENLGVKRMETIGQDFDPNFHEAISQEPSDTVPEGKIIREWKAGFLLNSKLLRTANVVVSSGKQSEEEKK
jgi:molecular chaperone GrpE